MVLTTTLKCTNDGIIWHKRPLVSSSGLISCFKNIPLDTKKTRNTIIRCVTFHPTSAIFVSVDEKGHVFAFFVKSNRYALIHRLGVGAVSCQFNTLQSSEVLVSCEDASIRCVDIHTHEVIATLRGHRTPALFLSFQKNGYMVLSGSSDAVILWDARNWTRYRMLNAGPGVNSACLGGEKEQYVCVCFKDDSIMMWDIMSFQVKARLTLPETENTPGLKCFAISPDCTTAVASGGEGFLYVWDIPSQSMIRIMELPSSVKQSVQIAFFSGTKASSTTNGTMIVILGAQGQLNFINIASSTPQINMRIAADPKAFITYSIDSLGRYLVTGTSDGCLLLHDLAVAREFSLQIRQNRRSAGVPEVDDEMKLSTRSAFAKGAKHDTNMHDFLNDLPDDKEYISPSASVPGGKPSKLVDAVFGSSTAKKRLQNREKGNEPHIRNAASLYQLAQLTESETRVNLKRLQGLLRSYGEYPSKYRLLIWKFLLRLPENNTAFSSLLCKGTHSAFLRLHEKYPIQSQRLFRRLLRVVSALAYWSPVFGEVPYLPALVFPFVKVCTTDDMAAFEIALSVILHWGQEWLQTFPHPPLRILTVFEDHLAEHDPALYDHLVKHKVNAQVYAWNLIRTLFTEVFSRDEWLRLFDHIFTHAATPSLLYVAVYAYLVYFRSSILSAADAFTIEALFHQQNAIEMNAFIKLMYKLQPSCSFDMLFVSPVKNTPGKASSTAGEEPNTPRYWPLPRGQYPAFHSYPKYVVDFQLQERERLAMEESELIKKRDILNEVEFRTLALKEEHDKWLVQQEKMIAAEEERRLIGKRSEKQRLAELRAIEETTRQRRLAQVTQMEKSAQEALAKTSKIRELEYLRMQDALDVQREREDYELTSRKEEERIMGMEFETMQRIKQIQVERDAEERARNVRHDFQMKEQSIKLKDKIRTDHWKLQDEERRLRLQLENESQEKLHILNKELAVQAGMEHEYLARLVEKESQILAVEKERRLRQLKEDEKSRLEKEMELSKHEQEVLMKETRDAVQYELENVTAQEAANHARDAALMASEMQLSTTQQKTRKARIVRKTQDSRMKVVTQPIVTKNKEWVEMDAQTHATLQKVVSDREAQEVKEYETAKQAVDAMQVKVAPKPQEAPSNSSSVQPIKPRTVARHAEEKSKTTTPKDKVDAVSRAMDMSLSSVDDDEDSELQHYLSEAESLEQKPLSDSDDSDSDGLLDSSTSVNLKTLNLSSSASDVSDASSFDANVLREAMATLNEI